MTIKEILVSLARRVASARLTRAVVCHLVYPTIIEELRREIRSDVPSPSGIAEAFAWKNNAYLVLAKELQPTGEDCAVTAMRHDSETRARLIEVALSRASDVDGDVLEFGVATGESLRIFAERCPNRNVWGFDSFEGLPEDWWTRPKGTFAAEPPRIDRPNVTLVTGLFHESLPRFLSKWRGKAALVHIDCDLHSSTQECLRYIIPRCGPGTVILFDEYYNYPDFARHEWLAWRECCSANSIAACCIGYDGRRAAFQITSIGELPRSGSYSGAPEIDALKNTAGSEL